MVSPLFRVKTFRVDGTEKCACIITGYRGRIASYKRLIKILNDNGYSVIAYEHDHAVLTRGKPELLPTLVEQICADFANRAANYHKVICVGASIGAGLCFAIQRQFPNVTFGIYAGAGVSPPETVYEAPLFYFVRKRFARLGFNKAALQKAWMEVDILPTKSFAQTPFIMALGKKDKIVKYDKALATLHAWQHQGQPIQIITKPRLGHLGIIGWYKRHFSELLAAAEDLSP
jgi:esterase/lipase